MNSYGFMKANRIPESVQYVGPLAVWRFPQGCFRGRSGLASQSRCCLEAWGTVQPEQNESQVLTVHRLLSWLSLSYRNLPLCSITSDQAFHLWSVCGSKGASFPGSGFLWVSMQSVL